MFQLHERLAADTHNLGRSRLCEILLMNDRTWPWIILVPAVPDIREIYQLGKEQQQRLLEESSTLSQGMMEIFGGDKMNVAALGNMVRQLHVHVIARHDGDHAWPGPVWGVGTVEPYDDRAADALIGTLRNHLTGA